MRLIYSSIPLFAAMLLAACASNGRVSEPLSSSPVPTTTPTASTPPSSSTIAVSHGDGAPASGSAPVGSSPSRGPGAPADAGGVKWTAPKHWVLGPEKPMRAATYRVPAAGADKEDGECAVFFFGPGQGGGVEANIERWIGQFEQPDGKPSGERAKRQKEMINGLAVTTIDLSGTYAGGGPMMGAAGQKKTGYRLLGAIVDGPQGAVFFKLTGPAATVAAARGEFDGLLKSMGK